MEDQNKTLSLIEKMRLKATSQKNYGGETIIKEASIAAQTCSNCGAGRAKQDGLTKCAYCGFQFHIGELTDGIYIKKEDNSK
jgi:uncharacterized Zn finger protein (UPF0148 family)